MNNLTSSLRTRELLSALADGELGNEELEELLKACKEDDECALASWSSYTFIGEVLRAPATAAGAADVQFLNGVRSQLAMELPRAILAVQIPQAGLSQSVGVIGAKQGLAANDESFGWKLVAGLATVAAVAAVAWNAAGFLTPAPMPQMAQASQSQQLVVASPQGPVVRDARLQELLEAHRQLGGASALQAPSGFLRNAAFDTSQDNRR